MSPKWLIRAQPRYFILLLSTALLLLVNATDEICSPLERPVKLPIHVRLLFAGTRPFFMRGASWSAEAESQVIKQLTATVRYPAQSSADEVLQLFTVARKRDSTSCSVVEYQYNYEIAFAPKSTVVLLDGILSKTLEGSKSIFLRGTVVADKFREALVSQPEYRASEAPSIYNLLVYNAASVAPQYGYVAEKGAPVETIGVASSHRFAFLDVGAKPFMFDDSHGSTPGERLLSVSSDPVAYAKELHAIVGQLFTPAISPNMHRFPPENRLSFKINHVDVSAVIGRLSGVGGDNEGEKPIGSTFSSELFTELLRGVFKPPLAHGKVISAETEVIDMLQDANMAMAVTRAFSLKGLELVLESEQLLADIVSNKTRKAGYFVDSSFVAHIPLFLFSFADDTRITHFESGEEIRAKVVGKQAVFLTENRFKDKIDDHVTTTSAGAKEVLELLCGLNPDSLSRMDVEKREVPLLLRDIATRNVLAQELDWSEVNVVGKAVDLLNFEGHDRRLIPHGNGTIIAECLATVTKDLDFLYTTWDAAGVSWSISEVEKATLDLLRTTRHLADKLHEEVCNQPLTEEILLEAEAGGDEVATSAKEQGYFEWFGLPAIAGLIFSVIVNRRARYRRRSRAGTLGEIPIVSQRQSASAGQWFSTLTASDKPKLN